MIALLARSSQMLNVFLAGSLLAGLLMAPGIGRPLVAQAQDAPPGDSKSKPPVPARPDVLPLVSLKEVGPPPALVPSEPPGGPKGDTMVPPIARKRPPPGQTSVPIVAPPAKGKQPVTAKKGPAQPAAKGPARPATKIAKGKAPPPSGPRAGLGVKPTAIKCGTGQRYDSKALKCVAGTAPVPPPTPAAAKPAPEAPVR